MHLTPSHLQQDGLYFQMGPSHTPNSMIELDASHPHQSPDLPTRSDQLLNEDAISLDSRRLQAQHTTEGYRDGIITGKTESIQAGFDEGFSLGAHIGLRTGQILGLLDGLANSMKESDLDSSGRIVQLLWDAKQELSIENIFSEQYWTSDGSWKYEVKVLTHDNEVTFENIAGDHPIIMKWDQIVEKEISFLQGYKRF
ncbi:hypothetical protein F4776DRAFT_403047 [Hypoxylon sp. NC0597]|nr:hypothetical protein F4776DRAFT_403047 [Hypoxylon sp. NC0597]